MGMVAIEQRGQEPLSLADRAITTDFAVGNSSGDFPTGK